MRLLGGHRCNVRSLLVSHAEANIVLAEVSEGVSPTFTWQSTYFWPPNSPEHSHVEPSKPTRKLRESFSEHEPEVSYRRVSALS